MANSIVSSKITTRFGHIATIGIPPVCSGQARWVIDVSQ
jgi:hypothetical protein